MMFEDHRYYREMKWLDKAEQFYRDLIGETVRARRRRQRFRFPPEEEWAGESAVGQARISDRQYTVEPRGVAIHRGASLDDVLLRALARRTGHCVILGDAVAGTNFTVHSWGPAGSLPTPRSIEFDATGVAALIVNGGYRLYVQANPTAVSVADKLLWVHVPSVEEFLSLPSAQRTSQRSDWAIHIRRAGVSNPATQAAFTMPELSAVSTPVLRTLLAHHAAGTLPVGAVTRSGTDRGGAVRGVTLPMLRHLITEPQVYLRVIAMAEGKVESINAWDAEAGLASDPSRSTSKGPRCFAFSGTSGKRIAGCSRQHSERTGRCEMPAAIPSFRCPLLADSCGCGGDQQVPTFAATMRTFNREIPPGPPFPRSILISGAFSLNDLLGSSPGPTSKAA